METGQADGRDPRWALTLEIVDALLRVGRHVTVADARPVQRLVDIQWAGHQAARILGGRAGIALNHGEDDAHVTVTITYEDPDGTGFGRSQRGLVALSRSVRDAQDEMEAGGARRLSG